MENDDKELENASKEFFDTGKVDSYLKAKSLCKDDYLTQNTRENEREDER